MTMKVNPGSARGGKTLKTGVCLSALALTMSWQPVHAADDDGIVVLEEITVTARKRSENLQSVPVSVSAMTADAIDRSMADNLQHLEGMAPNVVIDSYNAFPNAVSISIRGISHTEIEKSFDPAIGVVVDGVFMGTNAQAMVDNFDLERVEILRGPQGTLFGKNTIGGTINVVRKKPEYELSGKASYGYSSFDRHDLKAAVNLPVADDKLALRLAGSYSKSDGHLTNTATGEKLSGVDTLSVRAAALYNVSDEVEVYLNLDHTRDRSDLAGLRNATQPTQLVSVPGLLGLSPAYPGYPADTGPLYEVRSDLPEDGTSYDTTSASLEVNVDKGDYIITSISAYRWVDEDVYNDFDAEDSAIFNSRRQQEHDQFTQEVRLTSNWSDTYEFVAGLYYFWSDYSLHQEIDLFTDWITCGSLPGAYAAFGCRQSGDAGQTTNSVAGFFQGNANLTDKLRVTVGGRYTYEKKEFESTPIVYPYGALGSASDDESWSKFTPRIGLDYRVNDEFFLYGSFSRGFKSGGYNGRAGTVTSLGPYDPEQVDSYEVGVKSTLLDRSLRLNIAAFYNDYKNMQVELLRTISGGTGQETIVANAAAAETYGVEAEFTYRPIASLTFSGNIGILEASYKNFVADIGLGGVMDNSDLLLRKAPSLQYSLAASYEHTFGDFATGLFDIRYRWADQLETTTQNYEFGHRRSVGTLDASIALEDQNGVWTVSLFGRNLTNEEYIQDGLAAGALLSITSVSIPRTWGAQLELSF
ncbi:TonB-dependent receptor [Emcibacter sp.]|uniref:TonB-dependent receptor n=1 Tax=Emcibacter sp. TaxID=1979954 RepID=UPI003A95BF28